MNYAVISDVHSNWEALECVLAEIKARKADRIICLGDTVGYGANPSECLGKVLKAADEIILGNHDEAIFNFALRDYFNPLAKEAIEWTQTHLTPEEANRLRTFTRIVIDRKANVTWTHASLDEPEEYHYLFSASDAGSSFKRLETDVGFFGHTHIPSLCSEKAGEFRYLPAGTYELNRRERYLLNPGSVGQPRDRNPKTSFGIFDSDGRTFEIVRLSYDNKKTAEKIRKAGLPAYFADRLL